MVDSRGLAAGFDAMIHLALLATAVSPSMQHAAAEGRITSTLIDGWRFVREDAPNAAEPGFDDSAWQQVRVPHTWNAEDGQDGGANYYRGVGWYRRAMELPRTGGRVFIRFGAANTAAEVFLDGRKLTEHRGGHTAFCAEIPAAACDGRAHTLAVRVDNCHNDDIPPWDADFTFFGGLYRDVTIIQTGEVCISPLDRAAPGVRVVPDQVSRESASFRVDVSIDARQPASVRLSTKVLDMDGKTVGERASEQELQAGSDVLRHEYRVESPRLWNGRRDPHLYSIRTELLHNGQVVDVVTERFGLRFCSIDPQRGFLLNGGPYPLRGVNKHQDRQAKGWAVSADDIREDFALIKEIGATAVRLAHYPHDPLAYALCDEIGLVAWAEIPLVNRINDTPAFRENTIDLLREMIRQHANHPSIVVWGVHNEITAPWKPGPDPTALVQALHEVARIEDASRPTTSAGTAPWDHPANWIVDAPAFNRYAGWYESTTDALGQQLDATRAAHPGRPIGLGEYGAGASVIQHELPARKPEPAGKWHPEEYQSDYHEQAWRVIKERPWLWCTFVWNMFDFAADQRSEGDHLGRNDKGLVTYDRKTRKDAFWFYKANWSDEPVLYIADRRFDKRNERQTRVKVYSNAINVALRVNGRELGTKSGDLAVFLWDTVTLQTGENKIEASADIGGRTLTDTCTWTCE